MIVKNVRPRLVVAMKYQFQPGNNVVPDAVANELKRNKGFDTFVKDGTLVIQKEEGEAGEGGKLTAAEMIAVVRGMNSTVDLKKLKETETRKSVVKAINARIEELTKNEEKPDGDSERTDEQGGERGGEAQGGGSEGGEGSN